MTRFALREAVRGIRRGADRAAIVALAVAVTFALLGAFLAVDRNLAGAIAQVRRASKVAAYLKPGAPPEALAAVGAAAEALEGAAEVRVVAPDEALEEFRSALGPDHPIFEALDSNPLPGYVEVTPAVEDPAPIAEALAAMEGVEEVDYGAETLERVGRLAVALRTVGLAVGGGVFLFAFLLIATTEGLAAYARREEIEVLHLLGADDSAVLGPFWIEGAILGAGGAVAGLSLDSLVFDAVVAHLALPAIPFRPVFLDAGTALLLVVAGAAMGALGGLVAAVRFLRAEVP